MSFLLNFAHFCHLITEHPANLMSIFSRKNQDKVPQKPPILGQLGEWWAQDEYRKRGYQIVAANEYNKKGKRAGEIDFIAKNKTSIVFVEVKTRTAGVDTYGKGVESVNVYKQRKLLLAVKMYLLRNPHYTELRPQIDVCAILVADVDKPLYSVKIIENSVEDWN